MKNEIKFFVLIIALISCHYLQAQDTLEVIVTWEQPEEVEFRCKNPNSEGSDLNNDGYDDFIHFSYNNATGERKFQFYFGSSNPGTEPDLEISTDLPVNFDPSWGGDLNGDGYKDIVFSVSTNWGDPGDIYICLGGEDIDLEPELILQGEDYVPDAYHLGYLGYNGGYDFNGDGYDDLLTYGEGPSLFWNGLVQIFLGDEELSSTPDFQIQGNTGEEFGRYRAVGDINGDGYDDLIVSRDDLTVEASVFFEVYLGGETIDTIPDYISEAYNNTNDNNTIMNYAKGDINNDGFNDVLISGTGIFLGNRDGVLHLDYPLSGYLKYANINDDEFDDILCYNFDESQISIYYGSENFDLNADITINTYHFSASSPYIFCNAGDFNNDGEDEILINDGDEDMVWGNSATLYGLPGGDEIDNYELEITNYKLNNYPNPFNPKTTISFSIKNQSDIELTIYNIKGQKIKTLIHNKFAKGSHSIIWNADDELKNSVSPGIYFYKLNVNGKTEAVKRCLLLK